MCPCKDDNNSTLAAHGSITNYIYFKDPLRKQNKKELYSLHQKRVMLQSIHTLIVLILEKIQSNESIRLISNNY
jgi:hypothetical protein